MKITFLRFINSGIVAVSAIFSAPQIQAGGINSVLDGMFVNATGPNYVQDQLRGGISGGGVYVRSPVSSIQILAIDPPRFSMGCGGIDAYLGSFSFITADRLIQFLRNIAQNAAPLAFKMALSSVNQQLSGALDKFQAMAQQANDLNKNSCQLAHGLLDGKQNPTEVMNGLTKTIGDTVGSVKGWFSDFGAAKDNTSTNASETEIRAAALVQADGKKIIPDLGNITWNALRTREIDGFSFLGIADDSKAAKEILMSTIGTVVRSGGASNTAEPTAKPYAALLSIQQLINPPRNPDGTVGVQIWTCSDTTDCKTITSSFYATAGLKGYVNKQMMGTEDVSSSSDATAGSIVANIFACSTATCSLTAAQIKFLNAVGSVPTVGLLRRAQRVPQLTRALAPVLIEEMTNEIAIQYAESILSVAITSYSGTQTPKPEDFELALTSIRNDLDTLRMIKVSHIERMNVVTANIDNAIRAASKSFTKTNIR